MLSPPSESVGPPLSREVLNGLSSSCVRGKAQSGWSTALENWSVSVCCLNFCGRAVITLQSVIYKLTWKCKSHCNDGASFASNYFKKKKLYWRHFDAESWLILQISQTVSQVLDIDVLLHLRLLVNDFNPDPVDSSPGFGLKLSWCFSPIYLNDTVIKPTCVTDPPIQVFPAAFGHAYPWLNYSNDILQMFRQLYMVEVGEKKPMLMRKDEMRENAAFQSEFQAA